MLEKSKEMIHAEQLWKYLDDLSQNNPEEYKKFISHNIKEGAKSLNIDNNEVKVDDKSNNSNKLNNSYQNNFTQEEEIFNKLMDRHKPKITPSTFMSLRFKIKSFNSEDKSSKNDIQIVDKNSNSNLLTEIPKIHFTEKFTDESFNKNVIQEPKIYLNILYSDEFYPPLNQKNEIEDKYDKWNYIPTRFRPRGEKRSMRNIVCLFFECLVHSRVKQEMCKNDNIKAQLLSHIAVKFNVFISDYCQLFLKNVKMLTNHKYKSISKVPENWIINESYKNDVLNDSINNKQNLNKNSNDANSKIQSKNEKNEEALKKFIQAENLKNEIKLPTYSENYPGEKTFYNPDLNNHSNNKNKVKDKNLNKNKTSVNTNKISTEIENQVIKTIKLVDKKVLDSKTMSIILSFEMFDINSVEDIVLEISNKQLKLTIKNFDLSKYTPIFYDFNSFEIEKDKCTSEFYKKSKILIVNLIKK